MYQEGFHFTLDKNESIGGSVVMKKKVPVFVLAVLGLCVLASCTSAKEGQVYVNPTSAIETNEGSLFIIALNENQTTGYSWQSTHDKETVTLLKNIYEPDKKAAGLFGTGGTHYFYFKALKPGTTEIGFAYRRSWESQTIDERKFKVNIERRENREDKMATKEFNLRDFTRIEVSGAFDVEIIQSDSFDVSVTADDFPHIRVETVNDILRIRRQGIEWLAPFHSQPKARIAMPILYEVTLAGASKGKVQNFKSSNDFAVAISGASHLETFDISVNNITIELTGASNLTGAIKSSDTSKFEVSGASKFELTGESNNIKLEVSGASRAELSQFPTQNADVKISGASSGTINLNGKLNANISGASNLYWVGTPIMGDIQTSGASNLHRK
jgi:predicted secreted protein